MHLVGAFAALCNSEREYSNNSVYAEMSAVAQGMQCPALPAEHDYAQRKPIERLRRSLGRDVAMQPKAIAPCNTSNNVEKNQRRSRALEKASIALGADKRLADAECLEAVNALWRAAFNFGNVLLYSWLEEMFAY